MEPTELKERILSEFPGAEVEVTDLTGTRDHYSLTVVSSAFEGLLPIKRHRLINDLLREELRNGSVHALQLNVYTPGEV